MNWKKANEELPAEDCLVWIEVQIKGAEKEDGSFLKDERKKVPANFYKKSDGYKIVWLADEFSTSEIVNSVASNGIVIERWCEMNVPN